MKDVELYAKVRHAVRIGEPAQAIYFISDCPMTEEEWVSVCVRPE